MRKGWTLGAVVAVALALGACEPMRETATQNVAFKTKPAGATIAVAGAGKCSTPCSLNMASAETHVAEVSRKGCYPTRAIIGPEADETRMLTFVGAYFGNGYELKPNPTTLKLNCGK